MFLKPSTKLEETISEIKTIILENFKELTFDEKEHKYFVNRVPLKTSVSGVIKNFYRPFQTEAVLSKITKNKEKKLKLKNSWNTKKIEACEKGHKIHLFGELYPFNKELVPSNNYEVAVVKFWKELPEHIVPVLTELRMYHKVFMFGGTMDILLYNTITKKFIIGDYKTNESLFKNYNNTKLLVPFSNLLDNSYNKYQIQLSLYELLFEQLNYQIEKRVLIHLLPNGEYKMYFTENLKNDIQPYLKLVA